VRQPHRRDTWRDALADTARCAIVTRAALSAWARRAAGATRLRRGREALADAVRFASPPPRAPDAAAAAAPAAADAGAMRAALDELTAGTDSQCSPRHVTNHYLPSTLYSSCIGVTHRAALYMWP
jgi:hypothetical protein